MTSSPSRVRVIVVCSSLCGIDYVTTAHALDALAAVVHDNDSSLSHVKAGLPSSTNVRFFSSLTPALSAFPDAAVVIATPPAPHYALAVEGLDAGRHVLVEKPICDTVHHAAHMVELAARAGVCLMVNHLLRYSGVHRTLLRLVRSGFVGDVTRVRMTRMDFRTARTTEDTLTSLTLPDVSMLLALCGNELPSSVACIGQKVWSRDVDDYININLQFANGVHAQIEASWMHSLEERRLVVYGNQGALILEEVMPGEPRNTLRGFKWSAVRTSDESEMRVENEEQDIFGTLEKYNDSMRLGNEVSLLRLTLEHFLHCVEKAEVPLTDGKEGEKVLRVLTAATDSMNKNGMPVSMLTGKHCPKAIVHETAIVGDGSQLGAGTKIWNLSRVMPNVQMGASCSIGQNVYIGEKTELGKNVKVKDNVFICDNVRIEENVVLGPGCVFTNLKAPRPLMTNQTECAQTVVGKGVTVGANATIACGVLLGSYCLVEAGSVVTADVAAHALVNGSPAKLHGWVSTKGTKLILEANEGGSKVLKCPSTNEFYILNENDSGGDKGESVTMRTSCNEEL